MERRLTKKVMAGNVAIGLMILVAFNDIVRLFSGQGLGG